MNVLQTRYELTLRRWVAWTLLVCMMLRALVPAGYMPDFAAAAQGTFKVVICTSEGIRTVTVALSSEPQHKQDSGKSHDLCPFGAAPATGTLPAPAVAAVPAILASLEAPIPAHDVILVWKSGPALGSRAPPVSTAA